MHRFEPPQHECVYEELTEDHVLMGENAETMPTEIKFVFSVSGYDPMTKPGLSGFLKPSVLANITEPSGELIWSKDGCALEEHHFHAKGTGVYTLCFYNNGPVGRVAEYVPASKKVAHIDISYFIPHHLIDDPVRSYVCMLLFTKCLL